MTKASRNNRGSTREIQDTSWRTPVPLVKAIARHFRCTFVLDAAATAENTLCDAFITKGMDTLNMSEADLLHNFRKGHRCAQEKTVHQIAVPATWCNPSYFSSAELLKWIEVGAQFAHNNRIPWVFLLPASRAEQDWYHLAIKWQAQFAFPEGRIAYLKPDGTSGDSPNHPSVVIAFNAPAAGPNQVTTISNEWRNELPKIKRVKK